MNGPLIEVCHGREADMGMGAQIDPLIRQEFSGPNLIEEDQRPHHLALARGGSAAHLKASKIAGARHDHRFDRIHLIAGRAVRVQGGPPAYGGLLV